MSLLSRLFKPKVIKALSLEEQIRALDNQSVEQLLLLTKGDHNEQLRDAAIGKLPYNAELLALALNNASARTQLTARKRIGQLLDQHQVTIGQLASDVPVQLDLITLASYSQQANVDVLESINDSAVLLQLACEGSTTQLRQAAAARIESRAELEQVCKAAQSKDKTVYKLAKAKLDVFKAGDAERNEAQAAMAQICDKLEKLAHLDADTLFKAKVVLLESEWQLLAQHTSNELSARYQKALNACQQQIAARAEHIAQAEESEALDQQAATFVHTAVGEIRQLITHIYSLSALSSENINTYRQQLRDLTQAVRLAANRNLPLEKITQEFEHAHQHANQLLDSFSVQGTLLQLTQALQDARDDAADEIKKTLNHLLSNAREFYQDDLPEALQTASQTLQSWRAQQAEVSRQAKDKLRDISELTRKGLWAAQQGMVRKARGVHKELQEKCADLGELPAGIQSKLDELNEALSRLSDWHEFAVTPKKEALVEQMQGLATSRLNPSDLATRIHELQDEWKSLSRGIQQADEALWEQFQQASQVAFAPCKEYFEAQSRERELNLNKRQELIGQLDTYLNAYDWDNAVWSDVEKTLKVARQEWQTYWPVPRKAAEELQTTFDGLMDTIHQKLKDFYQLNKTAKVALIEQAQASATAENLAQAIDKIKNLQAHWKTIGKSYPKEDQHLWHEFRKHCDAVFARRAQETAEQNQEREAQIAQAEALIHTLRERLALPATELMASQNDIAEQQAAFNALNLPRDKAKALQTAFNQTLSDITSKINAERNQAEIRSWQDLFALSNQLRQVELAVLTRSEQAAALTEALAQQLSSPPRLPSGGLSLLTQRQTQLTALTDEQQARNLHSLRILCIRADIVTNRETPESERDLRMNYLMQQLQQGLGKRDEAMEPLVFEWIALGAVSNEDYEPLEKRFLACLASGV